MTFLQLCGQREHMMTIFSRYLQTAGSDLIPGYLKDILEACIMTWKLFQEREVIFLDDVLSLISVVEVVQN